MQSNQSAEAFNSINHKLSELPRTDPQRTIYRVYSALRSVNNYAYEPEIIAIGPYHRGKDNLKMMEEYKLRYLQLLLDSRKHNVETYTSAVAGLEQKVRDCYAEPVSLNGAKFVEMLVLDGCFIIEFLRKYHDDDLMSENDPIFQMEWIKTSLLRDLILFENQIPFFVLCKLFDLIEGENQHRVLINYVLNFCSNLCPLQSQGSTPRCSSSQEFNHILDLVYISCFSSTDHAICVADPVEIGQSLPFKGGPPFIHSATELKGANVKFRKKECDILFKVEFVNGIMEMPPFIIEDRTECFLRNLIAYEQYFRNGDQSNLITDYMIFLDCLINSSTDVGILSKCGIIDNLLGDNEAVANTINRLGVSVTGPGQHFVYAQMFEAVNTHYNQGWNKSIAVLKRDVFYSPWANISFVVGVVILVMNVVQTVCSILGVASET